MKPSLHLLLTGLFSLAAPLLSAPTDDADRALLLKDVPAIDVRGLPGGISVFGPAAFPVIAGRVDEKNPTLLPVVAAARWDKGRVVLFGHDGFLDPESSPGTARLLTNAAHWVSRSSEQSTPAGKPRIAVGLNPKLAAHLQAAGFDAVPVSDSRWASHLDGFAAVCITGLALTPADVDPLEKFIRAGGGLITGVTGWGWVQIAGSSDPHRLATENPANLLLDRAGLAFSNSTPGRTPESGYIPASAAALSLLNATTALEAITTHAAGKSPLTPERLAQCSATLTDAVRSLPPGDPLLLPKLTALESGSSVRLPAFDHPLASDEALSRLLLTCQLIRLQAAPPEKIAAHPAAASFPGAVPKDAPRLAARTLSVDTAVPQWHSTGLYAAPGEVIHVTLPPDAAGKGLAVRIGCHTDELWQLDSWRRAPEISRRERLQAPETATANPFGGLIYIDVPDPCALGKIDITISGAIESPRFIFGQTTVADWTSRLRDFPAPWAELETSKVILSVPSEKIRHLDNPNELMTLWDRILDAEADLSTIPHERRRPERIVPDLQISAGYMHSGYPIMTLSDHSIEQSLSTTELAAGSWGHFHELGHNHQQPDWTFDGTVEVTCNLYSLYVMETVCGKPPGQGHEAMDPAQARRRLTDHLSRQPGKFQRWKSDPFLALTMYDELRSAFGWDTYKKVFAEYRALPQSERPKNDDEKRDQWLVRFSRATGKNLGPFFEAWGVPTTPAARQSIATLPPWMPADWPAQ